MFLSNGVKQKKEWWKTAFNKDYLTADSYFVSKARTKREISFLLKLTGKIGLTKSAEILDLACGYGTHAIALAKHEFNVTGIDTSEYFLKIARETSKKQKQKVQFSKKDMRTLSFKKRFNLIINMYTSFGYFAEESDNLLVLRKISRALKPKGFLLIDLNNLSQVFFQFYQNGASTGKNNIVSMFQNETLKNGKRLVIKKEIDPLTMHWTITYSWKERRKQKNLQLRIRLFSLPEFRRMLEESGLKIKRVWGYYDGSPYRFDSRRLIILARKAWVIKKTNA
ncbi:MAG: class I SAM-dependent methyltransferase [Candidatus Sungbacteria bacterium]|nr:class I SAM-dependent methyltransferase [Candidatus Sungbacteria bacterium]